MTNAATSTGFTGGSLKADDRHSRARIQRNSFWTALCVTLSFLTLIPLFSIVFLLLQKGIPLLTPSVFTQLPPAPGLTGGGFGNAIQGTAVMVGLALLFSTPLGILSAIYLNEYSPKSKLSNVVRFVAKLLTGIPSIICGVFAFSVVVLSTGTASALAGGVALAVLTLPTILLTTEQALLGVPKTLREASYGLGATKLQTIFRIVLPEALPAIITGIMLGLARAAGETAPVLFTAAFNQYWMKSLMQPAGSMSVLIYNFSTLPYDYQIQMAWTASLVLVALVTMTNITAQLVFSRRRR
ncbi:MAG: phosphate ABC transporter permease PstA [Verrucomicrobia bacterium]|nr:phosphate ABC transporter permease PstA [Verrucomicrobiota bacterium]MBV9643818.1 phosphate ABC transporter permease PstA [Verrucomicrobiota bacterium]